MYSGFLHETEYYNQRNHERNEPTIELRASTRMNDETLFVADDDFGGSVNQITS